VKDFQRIDWKIYNRPPYYQQWLCRDDTLKLAKLGNKGLADIDGQIISLKNQWDLDNAKGHALDRLGKLLVEGRNANPDEIYRMFLRLRTMLNTADGTVNDIIKIVKFIYASREIKITPDYPAALVIEYDGNEQEYFDYNAILNQVIGAGIGYHTRAMFDFVEDQIDMYERMVIDVKADIVETMESHDSFEMLSELSFIDHVYGRTAIVYGGGVLGGAKYNGIYKHDGEISYQRENLRYRHDGEIAYGSGENDIFATEDLSVALRIDFIDEIPSRDELVIAGVIANTERFSSARLYNSKMTHNGQYKWNAASDVLEIIPVTDSDLFDTANIEDGSMEMEMAADFSDIGNISEAVETHTIQLDVSEDGIEIDDTVELSGSVDISESAEMDEEIAISMIGYWTYGDMENPKYTHDGSIGFNYGEIVPA
jgi:hypothetical protein